MTSEEIKENLEFIEKYAKKKFKGDINNTTETSEFIDEYYDEAFFIYDKYMQAYTEALDYD